MADSINENLLGEIKKMSQEGKLTPDEVNRLVLQALVNVLVDLQDIKSRLGSLEDEKKRYPTMREMWDKDRKTALLYTVGYFAIGLIIFSPIIISDIREPLLKTLFGILSGLIP